MQSLSNNVHQKAKFAEVSRIITHSFTLLQAIFMKLLQATQEITSFIQSSPLRLDISVLHGITSLIIKQFISHNKTHIPKGLLSKLEPKRYSILSNPVINAILFLLAKVDFDKVSLEEIVKSVDFMLKIVIEKTESREYHTPKQINHLLAQLANVKEGEIVYDPASGLGGTLLTIYQFAGRNGNKIQFMGQECNGTINDFSYVYLSLHKIQQLTILYDNSFLNAPIEQVDVCVSDIPFQHKSAEDRLSMPISFIELILKSLKENGRAILLLPDGYFRSKVNANHIEKYIENNWIERVISLLPAYWDKSTGTRFIILVLNLAKTTQEIILEKQIKGEVFEQFYAVQKIVSTQEVIKNNFNLKVNHYVQENLVELNTLFAQYPTNQIVELGDMITFLKKGGLIPADAQFNRQIPNSVPYIQTSDLSASERDFYLNLSDKNKYVITDNEIQASAFLMSLYSKEHKLTYFNYEKQAIAISASIIAFTMKDPNINIEYVISQFYSRIFEIQWEQLMQGTAQGRIFIKDLLEIKIILPSIEEQYVAVVEFRKELQLDLEAKLIQAKQEIKKTEYAVISIAIHDLNQKLGAMETGLSVLKNFLERKAKERTALSWNETVVPIFEGDLPEEIEQQKLLSVLKRIMTARDEGAAQLAATREELQNNAVSAQWIEVKQLFITEIAPIHKINGFICGIEGEEIMAEIDAIRFKNMADNLIENAQIHGNATNVSFHFSYIQNKEVFRILYRNNGLPFPKDFDFERDFKGLYQKSSFSKGTGIGGYSINKTVELHSGSIRLLSVEKDNYFPIQIEFIFPVNYIKNIYYGKSNSYFARR